MANRTRYRAVLLLVLPLILVLGCDSADDIEDELEALRAAFGCNTIGQINLGQSVNGTLSQNDCQLALDGSFIDYYAFRLTSSTTVRIDLESTDFDAYLFLYNSAGGVITQDDDGGSGLNSRIVRQLSAGLYAIGANSFDSGETGAYTLRLAQNR